MRPSENHKKQEAQETVTNRVLLQTGITGSAVVAVCCFTPVLVILLGAVGLSAWVGWLDYVLIPALLGFVALALYAGWRMRRACASCETASEAQSDVRTGKTNG